MPDTVPVDFSTASAESVNRAVMQLLSRSTVPTVQNVWEITKGDKNKISNHLKRIKKDGLSYTELKKLFKIR